MKPGILLASPEGRKLIRKKEILRALNEYDNLALSAKDQGYLNLAKKVLLSEEKLKTTAS
ncbi:MAG: hypothetical protein CMO59_02610 [Verrucomicrobiales bacterium]|nr:hypothetical protein [Verrucomicrobiales bacterium]MBT14870.1 hypothetical protein [Verrucomicrobiales bacterium]|tara:strand:- start:5674 stop:5853 length:180 start_codon:yes stop_codon:yes gene_type:complete